MMVDVVSEVARPTVGRESGFIVFYLLFTSVQTPLGDFSVSVVAADVVVGCGCVVPFFPENAFDMFPESPHDKQKG